MLVYVLFSCCLSINACVCSNGCSSTSVTCDQTISTSEEFERLIDEISYLDELKVYFDSVSDIQIKYTSILNHTISLQKFSDVSTDVNFGLVVESLDENNNEYAQNTIFSVDGINLTFSTNSQAGENLKLIFQEFSFSAGDISISEGIEKSIYAATVSIDGNVFISSFESAHITQSLSITADDELNFDLKDNNGIVLNDNINIFSLQNLNVIQVSNNKVIFKCSATSASTITSVTTNSINLYLEGAWPSEYKLTHYLPTSDFLINVNTESEIVPLDLTFEDCSGTITFSKHQNYHFTQRLYCLSSYPQGTIQFKPGYSDIESKIIITIAQLDKAYISPKSSYYDVVVDLLVSSSSYSLTIPFITCIGYGGISTLTVNKVDRSPSSIYISSIESSIEFSKSVSDSDLSNLLDKDINVIYISGIGSSSESKVSLSFDASLPYIHGFTSTNKCYEIKKIKDNSNSIFKANFSSPSLVPLLAYDESFSNSPKISDEMWQDIPSWYPPGVIQATFYLKSEKNFTLDLSSIDSSLKQPNIELTISSNSYSAQCLTKIDFGKDAVNKHIKKLIFTRISLASDITNINVPEVYFEMQTESQQDAEYNLSFADNVILYSDVQIFEYNIISHVDGIVPILNYELDYFLNQIKISNTEFSLYNKNYPEGGTPVNSEFSKIGLLNIIIDASATSSTFTGELGLISTSNEIQSFNITIFHSKPTFKNIKLSLEGWKQVNDKQNTIFINHDDIPIEALLFQPIVPSQIVFDGEVKYTAQYSENINLCVCNSAQCSDSTLECDETIAFDDINSKLKNSNSGKVTVFCESTSDSYPIVLLDSLDSLHVIIQSGFVGIDSSTSLSNYELTITEFGDASTIICSGESSFNFANLIIGENAKFVNFGDSSQITATNLDCNFSSLSTINHINIQRRATIIGFVGNEESTINFIDSEDEKSLYLTTKNPEKLDFTLGDNKIQVKSFIFSLDQGKMDQVNITCEEMNIAISSQLTSYDYMAPINLNLGSSSYYTEPVKLDISGNWPELHEKNSHIIYFEPNGFADYEFTFASQYIPLSVLFKNSKSITLTSSIEEVCITGSFEFDSEISIKFDDTVIKQSSITFLGDISVSTITLGQSSISLRVNQVKDNFQLNLFTSIEGSSLFELMESLNEEIKIRGITVNLEVNENLDDPKLEEFLEAKHVLIKYNDRKDVSTISLTINADNSKAHAFSKMKWKSSIDEELNEYYFYTDDNPYNYPFELCLPDVEYYSSCEINLDETMMTDLSNILPTGPISVNIIFATNNDENTAVNFDNDKFSNINVLFKTSALSNGDMIYAKFGQNKVSNVTVDGDFILSVTDETQSIKSLKLIGGSSINNIFVFDNLIIDIASFSKWSILPWEKPITIIDTRSTSGTFNYGTNTISYSTQDGIIDLSPSSLSNVILNLTYGKSSLTFNLDNSAVSSDIANPEIPVHHLTIFSLDNNTDITIGANFDKLSYDSRINFTVLKSSSYSSNSISIVTDSYPFYIGKLMSTSYSVTYPSTSISVESIILEDDLGTYLYYGNEEAFDAPAKLDINSIISYGNSSFGVEYYCYENCYSKIVSIIVKKGSEMELSHPNEITESIVIEGGGKLKGDFIKTNVKTVEFNWDIDNTPVFEIDITQSGSESLLSSKINIISTIESSDFDTFKKFDENYYQIEHHLTSSFSSCESLLNNIHLESKFGIEHFSDPSIIKAYCTENNELAIKSIKKTAELYFSPTIINDGDLTTIHYEETSKPIHYTSLIEDKTITAHEDDYISLISDKTSEFHQDYTTFFIEESIAISTDPYIEPDHESLIFEMIISDSSIFEISHEGIIEKETGKVVKFSSNSLGIIEVSKKEIMLSGKEQSSFDFYFSALQTNTIITISQEDSDFEQVKFGISSTNSPLVSLPSNNVPINVLANNKKDDVLSFTIDNPSDVVEMKTLTVNDGYITLSFQSEVQSVKFENIDFYLEGKISIESQTKNFYKIAQSENQNYPLLSTKELVLHKGSRSEVSGAIIDNKLNIDSNSTLIITDFLQMNENLSLNINVSLNRVSEIINLKSDTARLVVKNGLSIVINTKFAENSQEKSFNLICGPTNVLSEDICEMISGCIDDKSYYNIGKCEISRREEYDARCLVISMQSPPDDSPGNDGLTGGQIAGIVIGVIIGVIIIIIIVFILIKRHYGNLDDSSSNFSSTDVNEPLNT